jgi:glycosyltransferase involved in cell wall biosynthesis
LAAGVRGPTDGAGRGVAADVSLGTDAAVTRLRVAVVMPPATDLDHEAALDLWPTFTEALEALRARGDIEPIGCCRCTGPSSTIERNGVEYHFEPTDRQLARRVADIHPDVVHVHGLGFTRLLVALRSALGRGVPILLQHHGERPPADMRSRVARRSTRHMVAGYLFTGAGQAEAFRRVGAIGPSAPVYDVLESASHLDPATDAENPELSGSPRVLWVGRLIASKDPLCAVRALAGARRLGSNAELHMLATDRTMEPAVRQLVDSMGLGDTVHLHPPVSHQAMAGWYRRADVYLSTSHHEGSNYSLIEALGFGCRPVVTEIPSHGAIVKDLARRFAAGDSEGAARLIVEPAVATPDEIIERSSQWLSWDAIAAGLAAAYVCSRRS